ncbi:hypothetical protein KIPB_009557, partial [Kipferlia bialata]
SVALSPLVAVALAVSQSLQLPIVAMIPSPLGCQKVGKGRDASTGGVSSLPPPQHPFQPQHYATGSRAASIHALSLEMASQLRCLGIAAYLVHDCPRLGPLEHFVGGIACSLGASCILMDSPVTRDLETHLVVSALSTFTPFICMAAPRSWPLSCVPSAPGAPPGPPPPPPGPAFISALAKAMGDVNALRDKLKETGVVVGAKCALRDAGDALVREGLCSQRSHVVPAAKRFRQSLLGPLLSNPSQEQSCASDVPCPVATLSALDCLVKLRPCPGTFSLGGITYHDTELALCMGSLCMEGLMAIKMRRNNRMAGLQCLADLSRAAHKAHILRCSGLSTGVGEMDSVLRDGVWRLSSQLQWEDRAETTSKRDVDPKESADYQSLLESVHTVTPSKVHRPLCTALLLLVSYKGAAPWLPPLHPSHSVPGLPGLLSRALQTLRALEHSDVLWTEPELFYVLCLERLERALQDCICNDTQQSSLDSWVQALVARMRELGGDNIPEIDVE